MPASSLPTDSQVGWRIHPTLPNTSVELANGRCAWEKWMESRRSSTCGATEKCGNRIQLFASKSQAIASRELRTTYFAHGSCRRRTLSLSLHSAFPAIVRMHELQT